MHTGISFILLSFLDSSFLKSWGPRRPLDSHPSLPFTFFSSSSLDQTLLHRFQLGIYTSSHLSSSISLLLFSSLFSLILFSFSLRTYDTLVFFSPTPSFSPCFTLKLLSPAPFFCPLFLSSIISSLFQLFFLLSFPFQRASCVPVFPLPLLLSPRRQ